MRILIAEDEEDIRKLHGGLKRVMPIGMYIVGEITDQHLETAKVFNEYYEKNGLGKFRIIKVNPNFYIKNTIIDKDDSIRKGEENNGKCI